VQAESTDADTGADAAAKDDEEQKKK